MASASLATKPAIVVSMTSMSAVYLVVAGFTLLMRATSALTLDAGVPDMVAYAGKVFYVSFSSHPVYGDLAASIQISSLPSDAGRLPSWLTFNASTKSLSGVPLPGDQGVTFLTIATACIQVKTPLKNKSIVCHKSTDVFKLSVLSLSWADFLRPSVGLPVVSPTRATSFRDGLKEDTTTTDNSCEDNQAIASLVLCLSIEEMLSHNRLVLATRFSDFLSIPVSSILLESSPSGSGSALDHGLQMVSAGPGTGDSCSLTQNLNILWALSCSTVRHLTDFVRVLQHNVDGGRLQEELNSNIVGWYVALPSSSFTRHSRRRRRSNQRTLVPTPVLTPLRPTTVVVEDLAGVSSADISSSIQHLSESYSIFTSDGDIEESGEVYMPPPAPLTNVAFLPEAFDQTPSVYSPVLSPALVITSSMYSPVLSPVLSPAFFTTSSAALSGSSEQTTWSQSTVLEVASDTTQLSHRHHLTTSPSLNVQLFPQTSVLVRPITDISVGQLSTTQVLTSTTDDYPASMWTPPLSDATATPSPTPHDTVTARVFEESRSSPTHLSSYSQFSSPMSVLPSPSSELPSPSSELPSPSSVLPSVLSSPSSELTSGYVFLVTSRAVEVVALSVSTNESQVDTEHTLQPQLSPSTTAPPESTPPDTWKSSAAPDFTLSEIPRSHFMFGSHIVEVEYSSDTPMPLSPFVQEKSSHSVVSPETESPFVQEKSSHSVVSPETESPFVQEKSSHSVVSPETESPFVQEKSSHSVVSPETESPFVQEKSSHSVVSPETESPFSTSFTPVAQMEATPVLDRDDGNNATSNYSDAYEEAMSSTPAQLIEIVKTSEHFLHEDESSVPTADVTVLESTVVYATPSTRTIEASVVTSVWDLVSSTSVFDIDTSTVQTTSTEPANLTLYVKNPIGLIVCEAGRLLELNISRVFFNPGHGNVSSLTFSLELAFGRELPSNFWLYLDSEEQVLKGIPLEADMAVKNMSVLLVARHPSGQTATDTVTLQMSAAPPLQLTHVFIMKFALDFQQFMHSRRNLTDLVAIIGNYFDRNGATFITVVTVKPGSLIISWSNNTLTGTVCNINAIKTLFDKMVRMDGIIRETFYRYLPARSYLTELLFEPRGACISALTTTTASTTTHVVSDAVRGVGLSIWAHVILPVLIAVLVFVLIILIIVVCNRRRRHRQAVLNAEKEAVSNDRNPIIFPDEIDIDDPSLKAKDPLVLPTDPHHLPLDSQPTKGSRNKERTQSLNGDRTRGRDHERVKNNREQGRTKSQERPRSHSKGEQEQTRSQERPRSQSKAEQERTKSQERPRSHSKAEQEFTEKDSKIPNVDNDEDHRQRKDSKKQRDHSKISGSSHSPTAPPDRTNNLYATEEAGSTSVTYDSTQSSGAEQRHPKNPPPYWQSQSDPPPYRLPPPYLTDITQV